MSESISVGRWLARTDAEGPGTRFAVWVQGCGIRCDGCFNPHLWSSRGGSEISAGELFALVPPDVEGVTLLGGEPFEQAVPLAEFARLVRARGQSVMTFTGFTLEELEMQDGRGSAALLEQTDLLVDGPYLAEEVDLLRPWVGSRNQRFHALTERYAALVVELSASPDRLEIRVSADGRISVNGWATDEALDTLLAGLGRRTTA